VRRFLQTNSDHWVFVLLVAIAVAGRMGRVDWNFTPVAAATLFAGFYFRNRLIAALVPLSALAISDLIEPQHYSRWVLLTVWGSMLLPAVLGPWLRAARAKAQTIGRGAVAVLAPSTLFFLATNFAVWAVGPAAGSGVQYSADVTGLIACYAAAIPFYAKMLAGDLFYSATLFGAWAMIVQAEQRRSRATVPAS
jgi:hypothetical protein